MTIHPKTQDLAWRLLTYEAATDQASEPMESATLRVYRKLRGNLCVLVGVAGFHALASRALTLARPDVPSLIAVQVAEDGNLRGMSEIEPPMKGGNEVSDAGIILISRLLGLLLMFLGETLTMNLVLNVWPEEALDGGNPRDWRKA